MIRTALSCLLFLLLFASPLHADIIMYAGPEIYHINRLRDGGVKQDGRIDGIRLGFDRLKECGWYLGCDYLYGNGNLKGKDTRQRPLKSTLTDQTVEIRLGFTFVQQNALFVPFSGWGYFHEKNAFHTLPFNFIDTFNYVVVGFLSGVNFSPLLSMGLNFKVKFMIDGESRVVDDPLFDDITLMMQDEIQCRLDFPITITPCNTLCGTFFQLTPFYEYRHFGGREGYPFNFKDTVFHLYGARFSVLYGF